MENKNLRLKAQELRKTRKFSEAIEIYKILWEDDKTDAWLGWEYAYCLKYNNGPEKALPICKQIFQEIDPKFEYNLNLMSWCVYEWYFDKKKNEKEHNLKKLEDITEFFSKHISHKTKNVNALDRMISKVIDKHKKLNTVISLEKIEYWLTKLDVNLLSKEPYEFKDKRGNTAYSQSKFEEYYALKTRSLFKLQKYEKCIDACEEALLNIDTFHHDNDTWFKVRKSLSLYNVKNDEKYLNELIQLAAIKTHSAILYEISKVYYSNHHYHEANIWMLRALLTNESDEMKLKIINFWGDMLLSAGKKENAYYNYCYCKELRVKNNWNISDKLESSIKDCEHEKYKKVHLSHTFMQRIWLKDLKQIMPTYTGNIAKILPSKKGFIKYNNTSVFFDSRQIMGRQPLNLGDKVNFCIIDTYDRSKKVISKGAAYIEILKLKQGGKDVE